jgi:hypothetical protein
MGKSDSKTEESKVIRVYEGFFNKWKESDWSYKLFYIVLFESLLAFAATMTVKAIEAVRVVVGG